MATLANTAGGMCGPLLAAFVMLPALGTERAIFALSAAYIVRSFRQDRAPLVTGRVEILSTEHLAARADDRRKKTTADSSNDRLRNSQHPPGFAVLCLFDESINARRQSAALPESSGSIGRFSGPFSVQTA